MSVPAAAAIDPARITFRPLTRADLPLMFRWLNLPHVARWWPSEGASLEAVAEKYGPLTAPDGDDTTRAFLFLYRGRPAGYIQTYLLADEPAYRAAIGVDEPAAGVDLFIGEPGLLYRGLGPAVLRRFLVEVVFAAPDVSACVIGPEVDNRAAIRAYEKTGFRYLRTVTVPGEPHPEYLMRITPGALAAGR